jgi:hypothetical protein
MIWVGLGFTFAAAVLLVFGVVRQRRSALPGYACAGLGGLAAAEWLMFRHIEPVPTYLTPIAWSCYILAADGAVLAVSGRSRLHDRRGEFAQMALLSVPLWLIFEAYNLRLTNWSYDGLPMNRALELLGYGWAFATITPGILETSDLVESFGWFRRARAWRFSRRAEITMMAFGAACLIAPLAAPRSTAAYLFALVWVGFIFLLDPINHRLGLESILGDLAEGRPGRFYSLLLSGFICGWFWEFWNYWASAKWHYVFPMFQQWKIFEMPVPGYLGFLPFAVECFVMYVTASWALRMCTKREEPRCVPNSQPDSE